jgi:hypothetical protein
MDDFEFDGAVFGDVAEDAFDAEAAEDLMRERESGYEPGPPGDDPDEGGGWAALPVDSDDLDNPYMAS